MRFNDFDARMRQFEKSLDCRLPADIWIVVRLDGRSFTHLTKELIEFERPFDKRFNACMVDTMHATMNTGFNILYGYTQSDEISLLINHADMTYGRETRKIISVLASSASVAFSTRVGQTGLFDCRIVPLKTRQDAIDYFRWRQSDCMRNCLNGWCYWKLVEKGNSPKDIAKTIKDLSYEERLLLLKELGVDYETVQDWQKKGVCSYYEKSEKTMLSPHTGQEIKVIRPELITDYKLPSGDGYAEFLQNRFRE